MTRKVSVLIIMAVAVFSINVCASMLITETVTEFSGENPHGLLHVAVNTFNSKLDSCHAERLLEIGDWLYQHGNHFYGTRTGHCMPGLGVVLLHVADKIYLYITDRSLAKNDTIFLPKLPAKVVYNRLLSSTIDKVNPEVKSLIVTHGDKLEITVLSQARRDFTFIEIVLDKDVSDVVFIDTGKRKLLKDHITLSDGDTDV